MVTTIGRLMLLRSFPPWKMMTAMTYMIVPTILWADCRVVAGRCAGGLSELALDLLGQRSRGTPGGCARMAPIGDDPTARPSAFDLKQIATTPTEHGEIAAVRIALECLRHLKG